MVGYDEVRVTDNNNGFASGEYTPAYNVKGRAKLYEDKTMPDKIPLQ